MLFIGVQSRAAGTSLVWPLIGCNPVPVMVRLARWRNQLFPGSTIVTRTARVFLLACLKPVSPNWEDYGMLKATHHGITAVVHGQAFFEGQLVRELAAFRYGNGGLESQRASQGLDNRSRFVYDLIDND